MPGALQFGLGFALQTGAVEKVDFALLNFEEPFSLESAQVSGDHLADGSEPERKFLMGDREGKGLCSGNLAEFEQSLRKTLANASKSDAFDEADQHPEPSSHYGEHFERDLRVFETESPEVLLTDEVRSDIVDGRDRSRVSSAIKHWHFSDAGWRRVYAEHDFAAGAGRLHDFHAALSEDKDARTRLTFMEQGFARSEAFLDSVRSERGNFFGCETYKQRDLAENRALSGRWGFVQWLIRSMNTVPHAENAFQVARITRFWNASLYTG